MRATKLTDTTILHADSEVDHQLFYGNLRNQLPCFQSRLGMIALLEGSCYVQIGQHKEVLLESDSFLVVDHGQRVSIRSDTDVYLVVVFFNKSLAEYAMASLMSSVSEFQFIEYVHYMHATIRAQLGCLIDLGNSCSSFHALKADTILKGLLEDLINEQYFAFQVSDLLQVSRKTTQKDLYQRIVRARAWIKRHCADDLNLNRMAEQAMIHPHHFLRLFKKAFDQTPHQYLIEERIIKAKQMLQSDQTSVTTVCQSCGFSSLSTFSGLFKKKVGVSPSKYKADSFSQF